MSMSDYAKNQILNHILTATAYASPNVTLHLALFTDDPTDALIATNEVDTAVDDTAYARQLIAFDISTPPSNGECVNSGATLFAGAVFGTAGQEYDVSHIAIFDAATAGNMIYSAELIAPITRAAAAELLFGAGAIRITQDN